MAKELPDLKPGATVMAVNGGEGDGWRPDPKDLGTVTHRHSVRWPDGSRNRLGWQLKNGDWVTDSKELRVRLVSGS